MLATAGEVEVAQANANFAQFSLGPAQVTLEKGESSVKDRTTSEKVLVLERIEFNSIMVVDLPVAGNTLDSSNADGFTLVVISRIKARKIRILDYLLMTQSPGAHWPLKLPNRPNDQGSFLELQVCW